MKNRRLALAGTLAILSAVALAPKAQAQDSEIIDFSGTVASNCTFSNTQNGVLVQPGFTAEYLIAESKISGSGKSGSTTITCTNPSTVSVSAPVNIQAPDGFNPTTAQAILIHPVDGSVTTASTNGNFSPNAPWNSSTVPLPVENNFPYSVGMVAGTNANANGLPAGTYKYQVTVTATID